MNALKKTVARLTAAVGLCGHFTNHSLRATAATRLYHKGIDEQVIKEVTGHTSDAVWSYKRTSDEQLKFASQSLAVKSSAGAVCEQRVVGDQRKMCEFMPYCVDADKSKSETFSSPGEVAPNSRLSLHKKKCVMKGEDGQCPPLCGVLETIDKKCEKLSVKKMKLSLKYCKKNH